MLNTISNYRLKESIMVEKQQNKYIDRPKFRSYLHQYLIYMYFKLKFEVYNS